MWTEVRDKVEPEFFYALAFRVEHAVQLFFKIRTLFFIVQVIRRMIRTGWIAILKIVEVRFRLADVG